MMRAAFLFAALSILPAALVPATASAPPTTFTPVARPRGSVSSIFQNDFFSIFFMSVLRVADVLRNSLSGAGRPLDRLSAADLRGGRVGLVHDLSGGDRTRDGEGATHDLHAGRETARIREEPLPERLL